MLIGMIRVFVQVCKMPKSRKHKKIYKIDLVDIVAIIRIWENIKTHSSLVFIF